MTRSTAGLTLLVQKTPRENPLAVARERSNLLCRNSSLFSHPYDAKKMYEPEPKIFVKLKVEYVIYEALRQARERNELTFMYEEKLQLTFEGRRVTVKPDFTVRTPDGRVYRWKHLGRLDREDYASDWRERRNAYAAQGLLASLVTTDDLNGIRHERVQRVLTDLLSGILTGQADTEFSDCHYRL